MSESYKEIIEDLKQNKSIVEYLQHRHIDMEGVDSSFVKAALDIAQRVHDSNTPDDWFLLDANGEKLYMGSEFDYLDNVENPLGSTRRVLGFSKNMIILSDGTLVNPKSVVKVKSNREESLLALGETYNCPRELIEELKKLFIIAP